MDHCAKFINFCEKHGDEVVERFLTEVCELLWAQESTSSDGAVTIWDIYQHDVLNHTISGVLIHEDVEYGFVVDNGNWNGTVVREFGLAEDVGRYKPPKPTYFVLVPRSTNGCNDLDHFADFLKKTKEAWFTDLEASYNYDRHFAPGAVTTRAWTEQAQKHGLMFVESEERVALIKKYRAAKAEAARKAAEHAAANPPPTPAQLAAQREAQLQRDAAVIFDLFRHFRE